MIEVFLVLSCIVLVYGLTIGLATAFAWSITFGTVTLTLLCAAIAVFGLGLLGQVIGHADREAWLRTVDHPEYPDPFARLRHVVGAVFPSGEIRDSVLRGIESLSKGDAAKLLQEIAIECIDASETHLSDLSGNRDIKTPIDLDRVVFGSTVEALPAECKNRG